MTLRLALRSLAVQPVRSIVLACGFGTGIAAMAGLLGVGEVILDQSRAPALRGGGDLVIDGAAGDVHNARFVLSSVLAAPPLGGATRIAAPSIRDRLYLLDGRGGSLPVFARGGIPSLERALGDPETAAVEGWRDTPADRAWAAPAPADVLRATDRFHEIPDVPARRASWAEWLYFNGRTGEAGFYLTFRVGPPVAPDRRRGLVLLQLERAGRTTVYSEVADVSAAEVLASAPDLRIGASDVRLDGQVYRIRLSLAQDAAGRRRGRVEGELALTAVPGRAMPPFQVRGADGWLSGYAVPVLSGELSGTLRVDGEPLTFDGGSGYHDHNWGFWKGVTWRWGQVAGDGLSFVWGRIIPPPDAADPERLPGLLVALGPEGPLGFSTAVRIEERQETGTGRGAAPRRVIVTGRSASLDLELALEVGEVVRTRLGGGAGEPAPEFLQLRGRYEVHGSVGDRAVRFAAAGAAETFRGDPSRISP